MKHTSESYKTILKLIKKSKYNQTFNIVGHNIQHIDFGNNGMIQKQFSPFLMKLLFVIFVQV